MKRMIPLVIFGLIVLAVVPAAGQTVREDAIWARTALSPITVDGVLDETAWAQAESHVIEYAVDAGIPGSGYKSEAGWAPVDPTRATLKFLVYENQLYMGAVVEDQSVGGSSEFNRFDGFLMGLKDHSLDVFPIPVAEYLYSWWYDYLADPQPAGQLPNFIGVWAELPHGTPRTPEQIAAWDAVTIVDGLSNDDSVIDTGYTVEMRFDLTPMGYDVTQPGGDVIEWNISIYDTDWFWPININTFSSNRVWWQGPWGNTSFYNEVRIFASPDVTDASGPVPTIAPEMVIPEKMPLPVIDGVLDESVWSDPDVYTFDIRWDDAALRTTYDGMGPFRSGQFQATVNGGEAFVLDPADATVKMYHRGDMLYMGFDVRDQVVQFHEDLNRWDGFIVTIDDRAERGSDNTLLGRRLTFQVDADGLAQAQDDLLSLVTAGDAEVAISLMAGTTVDTFGLQADNGYTAELAVDLKSLGYPAGQGDGALFFGVNLLDGDSFLPTTDSYGTRTWWYREFPGVCCPAWASLASDISGVNDGPALFGGYARLTGGRNASSRPEISFAMPDRNRVTIEIFDLRGRLVSRRRLGEMNGGENTVSLFPDRGQSSGVYLYRVLVVDSGTGALRSTLTGKTTLIR
jgi:hypothetical protein